MMQRKHWTAFVLLVSFLLSLAGGSLAEWRDYDDFNNRYRLKYAYEGSENAPYKPTCLSYVGFSRYISRDGGVANDKYYVLHGGVDEEHFQDYVSYLSRFGYSITFDTVQNDTRTIELRDTNAPSYMPVNLNVYYDTRDQSIVIAEPVSCEEAYDQIAQNRAEIFQPEWKMAKKLTPDVNIMVSSVIVADTYQIEATSAPFCENVFMSKVRDHVKHPVSTQELEDGTNVFVINGKVDENLQIHRFWLIKLAIESADPTLRLSDLEFCIGDDDVTVAFPFQIADELQYRYSKPLLRVADSDIVGDKRTIWMIFPSLSDNADSKLRLYASFAQQRTPLLERLNFGFTLK